MKRNDDMPLNYTEEADSMMEQAETAFLKTINFNIRLRPLFCEEIKTGQFKEGLFDRWPSVNKQSENKEARDEGGLDLKKLDSQAEVSIALRYLRTQEWEEEFFIEKRESKEMRLFLLFLKCIEKLGRWNVFFPYSRKNTTTGFRYTDKHYYGFFYT